MTHQAVVTLQLKLHLDQSTAEAAATEVGRVVTAWQSEPGVELQILDMQIAPTSLSDDVARRNRDLWQATQALESGTDVHRQRWATGELSLADLLGLARGSLFAPFDGLKRWRPMTTSDIAHPIAGDGGWRCVDPERPVPVKWTTSPTPVLNSTEWDALGRLETAVQQANAHPWLSPFGPAVTVATRLHRGTCQRCDRTAVGTSALVTIRFAGRDLTREYAL